MGAMIHATGCHNWKSAFDPTISKTNGDIRASVRFFSFTNMALAPQFAGKLTTHFQDGQLNGK